MADSPKKKRWFRFSLRIALAAVTLAAVFLGGWLSRERGLGSWFRPYKLERPFQVSARNNESRPLSTGMVLTRGDFVTLEVNHSDRWSAHGRTGPWADYSGNPGYPARLRMHYRVGTDSAFVESGKAFRVQSDGILKLFCRDVDISDNFGSIRVKVALKSARQPQVREPATAKSPNAPASDWIRD